MGNWFRLSIFVIPQNTIWMSFGFLIPSISHQVLAFFFAILKPTSIKFTF